MKRITILILVFALAALLPGQTEPKRRVTFFAPGSVYVYLQGAMTWVNPDHNLHNSKEIAFAPVLGVGFRAVNFYDRIFLTLEFDCSQAAFDSGNHDRKVRFYNFKLGSEFRIGRKRDLAFTTAFGVGSITYPGLGPISTFGDSELTFLVELGARVRFSRHMSLRTDLRLFAEPESITDDCFDEYYYCGDDSRLVAASVSMGFQFDF
jgi:hypothetical protein